MNGTGSKLLLSTLTTGQPPPRAAWPVYSQRFAEPGRSAYSEANAIWREIADPGCQAWAIIDLLRQQRRLPRELHYAYASWYREWDRFRYAYVDWRQGGNREDRRHGGTSDRVKAKRQRRARQAARRKH